MENDLFTQLWPSKPQTLQSYYPFSKRVIAKNIVSVVPVETKPVLNQRAPREARRLFQRHVGGEGEALGN